MFEPVEQILGEGGLVRLRFDLPLTLQSARLDGDQAVLALTAVGYDYPTNDPDGAQVLPALEGGSGGFKLTGTTKSSSFRR